MGKSSLIKGPRELKAGLRLFISERTELLLDCSTQSIDGLGKTELRVKDILYDRIEALTALI
jgi:hypothetical protein